MTSAATTSLREQAAVDGGFTVEPASAWQIGCEVCAKTVEVIAPPGAVTAARARVVRDGKAWMTAHRMICPGGPEKRSDRK